MAYRLYCRTYLQQVIYFVAWSQTKRTEGVLLACIFLLLKLVCQSDNRRYCVDVVTSLQSFKEAFNEKVCASKKGWLANASITQLRQRSL